MNDLYDFVCLVHHELTSKDFSYIDLFETGLKSDGVSPDESQINVYQLFNAWSVELLRKGKVLQAGLVYGGNEVLKEAVELLDNANDLIRNWSLKNQSTDDLNELVKSLSEEPEIIKRLTPDTKGRILYLLTQYRTSLIDDFSATGALFDRNRNYEKAALAIIEKGISSIRDWQETLEHMAEYNAGNNSYAPYIGEGKSSTVKSTPKQLADKAQRMKQNETWLKSNLLCDTDDWQQVVNAISKL
ncbi:MAG: hypothetical protein JXB34_11025 [Bacteroidales bacterium]|nr:hypothetical protein [Bacteroidales bacterium]